jgi:hypothetical protein
LLVPSSNESPKIDQKQKSNNLAIISAIHISVLQQLAGIQIIVLYGG